MEVNQDINISLTQFIDFSLKNGVSKVTKVREIKEQGEYHPAFDYWRELREAIRLLHAENKPSTYLDNLSDKVHIRKRNNYAEAIKQYKKFVRNKEIHWFDPGKAFWTTNGMSVRATPELGLLINGEPHLIKLYFKDASEKLEKRSAANTLTLMAASTKSIEIPQAKSCILNIRKCSLYPITESNNHRDMIISLEGEAAHFVHIWNTL